MKTKILYEDEGILVCRKPAGLPTQTAESFREDMVSELKNDLSRRTGKKAPYLGLIHRLDQPVEGLLVFAKTKQAAAELTAQLADGRLRKKYAALLTGIPAEKEGILTDYLKKEAGSNLSIVVSENDRAGKRAELSYHILAEGASCALAEIEIRTGRRHQIRVQMAHMGHPLVGDGKYGAARTGKEEGRTKESAGLALCAYYLELINPLTGKKQSFCIKPENPVFEGFLK